MTNAERETVPESPRGGRPGWGFLLAALLSATIVTGGVLSAALPLRFVVERPRLGTPSVLAPGETLRIEVRTSVPFWKLDWHADLVREGAQAAPLEITDDRPEGPARVLLCRVPPGLRPGAYDLRLSAAQRTEVLRRAVHLGGVPGERFAFVQLTDLHDLGGKGWADLVPRGILDEAKVIHPAFVVASGDLTSEGTRDEYRRIFDALAGLDVPVIVAPGNHDHRGWSGWLATFGAPYRAVDLGGRVRVVSLHTGHGRDQLTRSQFRWLEDQIAGAGPRLVIVEGHHPLFGERRMQGFRDETVRLLATKGVPIALSGHIHADLVFDAKGKLRTDAWQFEGPKLVTSCPVGAKSRNAVPGIESYLGYRLVHVRGNEVVDYTYDLDGDGKRDPLRSIPAGHLEVMRTGPRSVEVVNDLHEDFEQARVSIRVEGEETGLEPEGGRLVAVTATPESSTYELELSIPRSSRTALRLVPASGPRETPDESLGTARAEPLPAAPREAPVAAGRPKP